MRTWLISARGNQTQAEIANRASISQQMYSAIECGTATPSVATAKRIARALGLKDWARFFDDADKEPVHLEEGASA